MPFPAGWPPRPATNVRSLRFHVVGTCTGFFADNAFLFSGQAAAVTIDPTPYVQPGGEGAAAAVAIGTRSRPGVPMGGGQNPHDSLGDPKIGSAIAPPPVPMMWCTGLRIINTHLTLNLEFSFDGVTVQGFCQANSNLFYFDRYEAGIALRGAGGSGAPTFVVEAW